jgi:HPt (histidine-containing phosphotransfer) domain-containing protein
VLMDVSMPEIDGFEASRRIRAGEKAAGAPRLPIVAVTAHVVGAAADAWRTAEMDAVLYKPYSIRALAACLERFAPRTQSPPTLPEAPAPVEIPRARQFEAPLLNEGKLREQKLLIGTEPTQFLRRVLGLYLDHAPRSMIEMRQSLEGRDIPAIGRAAHALKSMSLNIGLDRVVMVAEDIERRAASGQAIGVEEVDALEKALRETLEIVRAMGQGGGASPEASSDEGQAIAATPA